MKYSNTLAYVQVISMMLKWVLYGRCPKKMNRYFAKVIRNSFSSDWRRNSVWLHRSYRKLRMALPQVSRHLFGKSCESSGLNAHAEELHTYKFVHTHSQGDHNPRRRLRYWLNCQGDRQGNASAIEVCKAAHRCS